MFYNGPDSNPQSSGPCVISSPWWSQSPAFSSTMGPPAPLRLDFLLTPLREIFIHVQNSPWEYSPLFLLASSSLPLFRASVTSSVISTPHHLSFFWIPGALACSPLPAYFQVTLKHLIDVSCLLRPFAFYHLIGGKDHDNYVINLIVGIKFKLGTCKMNEWKYK